MAEIPYRLQPDTPLADNLAYINQAFDAIDDENRTKIIRNGGIPQVILGYQKAGFGTLDYGLKISKINPSTGLPYDVIMATDDQLAFTSAFNYFKIVSSGTITIDTTGSVGEVVETGVDHGLGRVPAFLAYYYDTGDSENPDRYRSLPAEVRDETGVLTYSLDVSITPTRLDVSFSSPTFGYGPDTFNIRYYLMVETAN